EGVDGAIDQAGAIVDNRVFDITGQAEHRLIELPFDIEDNLAGVCAVANDDDAADRLAIPIQLGDASAHIRAELDVGHLTQENRNAFLAHTESDLAQVLEAIDVTADAQDEFLFRQLKRA